MTIYAGFFCGNAYKRSKRPWGGACDCGGCLEQPTDLYENVLAEVCNRKGGITADAIGWSLPTAAAATAAVLTLPAAAALLATVAIRVALSAPASAAVILHLAASALRFSRASAAPAPTSQTTHSFVPLFCFFWGNPHVSLYAARPAAVYRP